MMPGNPVSAFVSFEVFVRPVLRKMMGSTPYVRTEVRCRAAHDMTSIPGKRQFARGHVSVAEDGHRQVGLVGGHGSHLLGDARPGQRAGHPARGHRSRRQRRGGLGLDAGRPPLSRPDASRARGAHAGPESAAPQSGRRGADGRRLGEGRHGADRDARPDSSGSAPRAWLPCATSPCRRATRWPSPGSPGSRAPSAPPT